LIAGAIELVDVKGVEDDPALVICVASDRPLLDWVVLEVWLEVEAGFCKGTTDCKWGKDGRS